MGSPPVVVDIAPRQIHRVGLKKGRVSLLTIKAGSIGGDEIIDFITQLIWFLGRINRDCLERRKGEKIPTEKVNIIGLNK